jgi:hypothetical protein
MFHVPLNGMIGMFQNLTPNEEFGLGARRREETNRRNTLVF